MFSSSSTHSVYKRNVYNWVPDLFQTCPVLDLDWDYDMAGLVTMEYHFGRDPEVCFPGFVLVGDACMCI